jgi:hypothetical protein
MRRWSERAKVDKADAKWRLSTNIRWHPFDQPSQDLLYCRQHPARTRTGYLATLSHIMATQIHTRSFYAPPTTRLSDIDYGDEGWNCLGLLGKTAIVINVAQAALIGLLAALLMLYAKRPEPAVWIMPFATAAVLTVLGLWPWQQIATMRMLALLANFLWLLGTGYLAILVLSWPGGPREQAFGFAVALNIFPPATGLAAQLARLRIGNR